jgi:two-component system, cell cycle sensor histidine kinase and response regulator CckA
LAFSRGEDPLMEILHLNVLLRSLQDMLRRLVGSSIALELLLSHEATFFWGDRAQFTRVVLNLVTNARDAMPEGGRLTISAYPESLDETSARALGAKAGLYAVMVIRDTGAGIAAENLPHIFDPFFTTRKRHGRTGLGLSVVYGILQQHQGGIRVESHIGQGTTFYVYLPAVDAAEADEEPDDAVREDTADWRTDGTPPAG